MGSRPRALEAARERDLAGIDEHWPDLPHAVDPDHIDRARRELLAAYAVGALDPPAGAVR